MSLRVRDLGIKMSDSSLKAHAVQQAREFGVPLTVVDARNQWSCTCNGLIFPRKPHALTLTRSTYDKGRYHTSVKQRVLVLTGWRVGCNKVALTKALESELGHLLGGAKFVTDQVLAGETVRLALADKSGKAANLLRQLEDIGCEAHLEGDAS